MERGKRFKRPGAGRRAVDRCVGAARFKEDRRARGNERPSRAFRMGARMQEQRARFVRKSGKGVRRRHEGKVAFNHLGEVPVPPAILAIAAKSL
jgi:hypothetical protein